MECELAITPEEQIRGLQGRNCLPENRGMLFQYPNPQLQSFWMKDVPIPLSIAFCDRSGKIVKIVEGNPFSLDRIECPIPCKWVLEMAGGWFSRKGVGLGSRVKVPQLGSVRDLGGVRLLVVRKK